MATTALTPRLKCTTTSSALTALVPWTTTVKCVDRRCGLSISLRRTSLRPSPIPQRLSLLRLSLETNLETPQDLKHELISSSKRGQAKQLACRPHQTHLSFFTAVEFYRQRKLPDIPRKSPIHTGLERVTERSRRTSCMGFALFAPLFSFASGRAVPKRTAATKSTIFLCYGPLDTGTGSWGSQPNLIPHHQLIQHSLIRRPGLQFA